MERSRHIVQTFAPSKAPIPPALAPLLMMAFWMLLGGAAGVRIMQGIWPYFGFQGGEMTIAIPVGGVAGALAGAMLGLIRNPSWQVLLMAMFAGAAAGGVAGKVPWGDIGEIVGQVVGTLVGGLAWATWLFFERREPAGAASRPLAEKSPSSQTPGRYIAVSRFRRLVTDLMHFSAKVPSVTLERRMNLAPLIAARQACDPQPTWSAIFTRAFGLVAVRNPALRTAYLTFPWPRFYESAASIATLNIDRQLADERVVLYAHIASPENRTLQEIDAIIHDHQDLPVEEILSYRRAVRLSRVPWPFRRLTWWAGLNMFGGYRSRYFGTFGITSLGSQGAGITHLVPLLTSQLHYGIFDETGRLEMRMSFDHRVLDGVTAARCLAELEEVLLGQITLECARSIDGNSGS